MDVKMDFIERNYQIIEQSMINQMERSFEIGKKLIDTELDAGLFNFVVKPVVKAFYDFWMSKDARKGTLTQIKVTLDSGKELLNGSADKFEEVIEKNFPIYLEADQTYQQCKRSHRNFDRLVEITRECFISQVEETKMFLKADAENVNSYDDLCRVVFDTKEQAYKALMRQLDLNEAGIEIVERDPNILKLITGRKIIVKALRKGFEQTKRELLESLDRNFN